MEDFRLDFVGVGAAKAGTTWLHECLNEHPQVCMSDQKELHYFCTKSLWPRFVINRNEGENWLRARFSHCMAGQVRGEISVGYLVDPNSPRLIKERFPDAKIIISYRNPVESLRSLYHHIARRHRVASTLEGFIADYPFFIPYGFYYAHTMRYLDWFSKDKLHLILFDDICCNPKGVLVDLFRFLEVETSWCPASPHEKVNPRKVPRVVLVRDVVGLARAWVGMSPEALPVRRLVRLLGLHHLGDWIQEKNLRAAVLPPMKEETRKRLLAVYSEQNILLGKLLARDLTHWNE